MAYSKTNWEDAPSTATPLNAENLNHIEDGIYRNSVDIMLTNNNVATIDERVRNINDDISSINELIKTSNRQINLGSVTSVEELISYNDTNTIYTGSIAYQADYKDDFLMFIINNSRYLLMSDGMLWRFHFLTSTTATQLTSPKSITDSHVGMIRDLQQNSNICNTRIEKLFRYIMAVLCFNTSMLFSDNFDVCCINYHYLVKYLDKWSFDDDIYGSSMSSSTSEYFYSTITHAFVSTAVTEIRENTFSRFTNLKDIYVGKSRDEIVIHDGAIPEGINVYYIEDIDDDSKILWKLPLLSLLKLAKSNTTKADKATTLAGYSITDAYTKTEIDSIISDKANTQDIYTKDEVDSFISDIDESKADKAYTLAGYGITDTYTSTEIDGKLEAKANAQDVYTSVEVDNKLLDKANAQDVYTKSEINSMLVARYGVSFGGSANSGATVQRLYNAVGLTAEVGTDTVKAQNDFDNIYPWSARRRCCGTFDSTGKFLVNACEGEPGFKTDGSNGNVWIEHSLFYYKHNVNADGAEEIVISATQLADFQPAPIFVNPDGSISEKAYTAAYPISTVDGLATSRSGVFPDVCSLNTAMTSARTLGENFIVTTMAEWYTECLYMWVEFATRNLQTVMKGATYMAYNSAHTAVIAETGANRIIVPNPTAEQFMVGQTISIGTDLNDVSVADNRIVTAIEAYDSDNKAISFDGSAVDISVGNVVYSRPWKNGSCDSVISSSGSFMSNTSGKYNCVYRGKESPYGNINERICDILLKREGEGTDENPYTYDVYFLSEPEKYSRGRLTADYTKLNINIPNKDGYIKKLGYDSRFPFVRIPTEVGASSTTYYSDYYQNPDKYQWLEKEINAFRCGGSWNGGEQAGMNACTCYHTPSDTNAGVGARLSHRGGN